MSRGWEVYDAVSPSAPCDLVAILGDRVLRVEVKTPASRRDKAYALTKSQRRNEAHWDVVALVTEEGGITYSPPLDPISAA